eukprot:COSAG02_NODE_12339_length_1560_cov_1.904860_1_plen_425_part_10
MSSSGGSGGGRRRPWKRSRREIEARSGGAADEQVHIVLTVADRGGTVALLQLMRGVSGYLDGRVAGAVASGGPAHVLQPPGWPQVRPRLGVDVRDETTGTLQTALHVAAHRNDTVVAEALLAVGAAVDPEDSTGRTPLCFAARVGATAVAKILLDARACLEPAQSRTATPLHIAARYSRPEVVRLLCHAGARLDHKHDILGTPLHVAARRQALPIRDFRDPHVGENPAMDVVEALLEAKAPVNARDKTGQTPLHVAVSVGCVEQRVVIWALLSAGADPDLRDNPTQQQQQHHHHHHHHHQQSAGTAVDTTTLGLTPLESVRKVQAELMEHSVSGLPELPRKAIDREATARGLAACAAALQEFDRAKKRVAAYQRLAWAGSLSVRLGARSAAFALPSGAQQQGYLHETVVQYVSALLNANLRGAAA